MNQTQSVIEVQNVSKRFGQILAVNDLSVSLQEGEFFALLGPSGCGKTTLLRIIAGFERPDTGSVLLDGKDMTNLRANQRPINLMFQSYALFPHMNVRANISYGLEMEKLSRSEIKRRADEILDMTQLQELAGKKPDQISGGQKQRVALARALVKRPRVLLLDEPLGALDKKLRDQMRFELKRLQHELGITFVVVTHDQDEALVMADRIALMKDGVIVQSGAPSELYENPCSKFVADFIGSTNFFDGKVTAEGLSVDGHGTFKSHVPNGLTNGTPAVLAVRPERIKLSPGRLEGCNAVSGKVVETAYHGDAVDVLVNVATQNKPVAIRLPIIDGNLDAYRVEQTMWCNWKPEHGRILTD